MRRRCRKRTHSITELLGRHPSRERPFENEALLFIARPFGARQRIGARREDDFDRVLQVPLVRDEILREPVEQVAIPRGLVHVVDRLHESAPEQTRPQPIHHRSREATVFRTIVSNFTNHLYAIAEDFCNSEHVNFNLLKPLIMETASRIRNQSPAAVQTGPAVRKDILTMDKHLRLLINHPKLRTTYLRLTDSIMNP